jgi:cell division protein FtsI (penicillin-binding protein 3)
VAAPAQRQANRRIRLLLGCFVLVFAGTLARAVWLQGVSAGSLGRMAEAQHREVQTIPASRGTIYDRDGVRLAIGEQATTVYADPRLVTNARGLARTAQRIFGTKVVDANELYPQLVDKSRAFVYIARKGDPDKAAAFVKRGFDGVNVYPEERRAYPQHTVAGPVLGYAGLDNEGVAGLEYSLDKLLRGVPGKQTIVRDPFGRAIDTISSTPEREGADVFLTIDHTIQAEAESVLRKTVQDWGAKSATAIVLDPRNGEILAMAQAPTYDANNFARANPALTRNTAVTDSYEPGSTFKLVTVSGALAEGIVTPRTQFTLPYTLQVADRVIHDAEERGTETLTVAQILSHSSNVGTVTLAQKLGGRELMRWMERYGIGRSTGLDFPGESPGIVLPYEEWSGSTIGNVPIGQGVAVTPVQMAAAYAAVANGGVWVQPHLVEKIARHKLPKPKTRRILTPGVNAEVAAMLGNVVADGTGVEAQIPGYHVAGKTGTAQKPDAYGGYSGGDYVASFVGFVPASKPRLVVLVKVDEPTRAIWGGTVAAPAFREIASFGLQYLEIPPDAPRPT